MSALQPNDTAAAAAGVVADLLHRHHNLVRTRDLGVARDYMCRVIAPHRLALSEPRRNLSFRHSAMALDRLQVHLIEYSSDAERVEIDSEAMGPDLMLKIPLSGMAQVSQGSGFTDLRPGQVYLSRPGRPFVARLSGDYSHLSVQIDPDWLGGGEDAAWMPDFDNEAINAGGTGRMLAGAVLSACHLLTAGGLPGTAHAMIARAQAEMLRAMLITMPRRGAVQSEALPWYLHRAECYMRANLTEEVSLDDLVRIAGVSRRSLHAGFRRFRDTTPMKRFKEMRLAAAHADLLGADQRRGGGGDASVTEIATRYNFFQLSKFSRDFQVQFGQLPSQISGRRSRS